MVFNEGLQDGESAKLVRLVDGVPVTTDGPFAETKESLAGFWVLDVADEARVARDRRPDREVQPGWSRSARSWTCAPESRHASRTCCASWRRRSSAPWCAGTATSTPARTRSRRRCSPRRCSGRRRRAGQPAGLAVTVASRRLIDGWRSESARRRREEATAAARRVDAIEPGPTAPARRRHADPAVPVLPPGAVAAVAARADAARRRRPDHRRDRARVPGARGDDGPAHQPGQADDQQRRRAVRAAAGRPSGRAAAASSCTCSTSIFNEGYTASSGPGAAPRRPDRRGDPAGPAAARAAARRRRGRRAARADAAHRGPARGPHRRRRRAGAAGRAGPLAVGRRGDRGGRRARHRTLAAPVRAVPAAGGDRRGARRGPTRRAHRLAADPRPLRPAGAVVARAGGHAEPGGRGRDGARPARRAGALGDAGRATRGSPATTALDAVRAHLLEMAGDRAGARRLPRAPPKRTASLPRTALPDPASRPAG